MAVLDLVACPICQARESLVRQTTKLESRTHVTYECLECGTLLAWLGDDMWLEADRWSFQKVGRPERADLLYRSMTAAELRKLAGEQPPYTTTAGQQPRSEIPPPIWIEMTPAGEERFEEPLSGELEEEAQQAAAQPEAEQEEEPDNGAAAPLAGAAILASQAAQPAEAQRTGGQQAQTPEPRSEVPTQEEPRPASTMPAMREGSTAEVAAGIAAAGAVAHAQQAAALDEQGASLPSAQSRPEAPSPEHPPTAKPPTTRISRSQRRGRGSPFLVISVGLVLLCLICSAAVMVIYSMWERLPAAVYPAANAPASEAQPTDTMAPTDTPAPSPTAAPEHEGVEFQGVTSYLSSGGSHYLVGEVLNRSADTLRFVEVLATFYDADGQQVGTGSTFTELGIIEPGGTAPFKMATLNPPEVGHYDLRVDYSTTTQAPVRLEVAGHSGAAADTGWYQVTGDVRNPHSFAVKFPEIVATYYNGAHEVVRVETGFAEVDPLEPGGTSAFAVVLTDPPADLQHYTLQTEAVQQ